MKKTTALLAPLVFAVSTAVPGTAAIPAAVAGIWKVDKAHSEVGFQIRHFVSKVRGRFGDFAGTISVDPKPGESAVVFWIKAASIDTNEPKRDADLRSPNFFDVEKFPDIRFVSKKILEVSDSKYDVMGNLTMHGVTNLVNLSVTFTGTTKDIWGGERAGFEVGITLNRKDYGITWNKALDEGGFMLGDEVTISINIEAVKEKPAAPAK